MYSLYKRTLTFPPRERITEKIKSSIDFWELVAEMQNKEKRKSKFFYFIKKDFDINKKTQKENKKTKNRK